MAKPKLALIPAAYGTKFYSILPSDGVGDFDFSRGSVATRINPEGLIENVASGQSRLNYPLVNGVVKGCPHYLLERSRTNLIPYSEDFTQSTWVKQSGGVASAPVVTSNYSISPAGTLNADRIIFNNGGGSTSSDFSQINDPVTASIGDVSNSVYIKSNTTASYTMSLVNSVGGFATILVTTEWQRFEVNATTTTTAASFRLRLRGSESTSDFADVSVWGAQLEEGSFATSYIPTSGQSGGVTRSAETANGAGDASTFNSTEGVLMVESKGFSDLQTSSSYIQLSKNGESSATNSLVIQHRNNGFLRIYANGFASANIIFNVNIDFTQSHKIAVLYKLNGYRLFIDGFEQSLSGTPTQTVFSGLDNLAFDLRGGAVWNSQIKQLQYFDSSLTEAELQALTTI